MKTSQIFLIITAFALGCGITVLLMRAQQPEMQPAATAAPVTEIAAGSRVPVTAPLETLPPASLLEAQEALDEALVGLDGNLKTALDLSVDLGRGNYEDRFLAITRLGDDLSDAEVLALAQFLYLPFAEQQGMELLEFNALKNEAMGKLVSLGSERVDAASVFSSIAQSEDLDDLIRDYAIQFSYHLYEESQLERESISYDKDLASMALKERHTTLAGTALLGEVRLSEANPEDFPSEGVASAAWNILNDSETLEENRVSALISLTRLGEASVLPRAREVLETSDHSVLTIAALGSVREFDDTESIPAVRHIAASTNPSISRAARYTLKHLESL